LQTLKLVLDRDHIHDVFRHHNVVVSGESGSFLGGYYGKGMAAAWSGDKSQLHWDGKPYTLPELAKPTKALRRMERLFFIPAQRVMSLASGVTQNFGQFHYGDPYTLRYFSDVVHDLHQNEFGSKSDLFPQSNRLNETLRKPVIEHLYGGSRLTVDSHDFTKRLVLKVPGHQEGLPYTAWSAGQREFTPMLLGLYWLCPAGGVQRREGIEWVVLEEPEMGLHPQGIEAVLLLVLELMRRGYKVILSTHSPVVLDLVWALQEFKAMGGTEGDVRKLLNLGSSEYAKSLGNAILAKECRVYAFSRDNIMRDISRLSPMADESAEAEWGGPVGFASRTGQVIADVVNRAEIKSKRARTKPRTASGADMIGVAAE
jgi:hypothetical protein